MVGVSDAPVGQEPARELAEPTRARREQILQAAANVFTADGFHAASMAQVIAETGLGAGTVYRYFPSKEDLIVEVAHHCMIEAGHAVAIEASKGVTPTMADLLRTGLSAARSSHGGGFNNQLILHSWAEASRNPRLAELLQQGLDRLVQTITPLCQTWQERGKLPAGIEPKALASLLVATIQGCIVQQAIAPNHQDLLPVLERTLAELGE